MKPWPQLTSDNSLFHFSSLQQFRDQKVVLPQCVALPVNIATWRTAHNLLSTLQLAPIIRHAVFGINLLINGVVLWERCPNRGHYLSKTRCSDRLIANTNLKEGVDQTAAQKNHRWSGGS